VQAVEALEGAAVSVMTRAVVVEAPDVAEVEADFASGVSAVAEGLGPCVMAWCEEASGEEEAAVVEAEGETQNDGVPVALVLVVGNWEGRKTSFALPQTAAFVVGVIEAQHRDTEDVLVASRGARQEAYWEGSEGCR
jgi:hypothetical protein